MRLPLRINKLCKAINTNRMSMMPEKWQFLFEFYDREGYLKQ